ncbi:hypothetical protein [Desulfoscipio geothermicus]|uniref:Uncharacterized protein n=1 Tax=Desulfoscipio geothermicus DSM 3669 TaxID=1121426 RepID=A0A1I6EKA7_9FIRM|nr:hypothetical protein [Desulfoscipio geothermicus]SFR18216.1 hypothetical protein SAMN05660706_1545 [Desulfoscipio geothermicus DSM 3669]
MSLFKVMRFVSVFVLAVAVVLSAASMKAAEAGTPEVTVKVNDGVPLKDETIKLSEDGRSLILEDGTCLKVNLNDAVILNDKEAEAGTPEVTVKVNDGVPLKDETIKLSEDGRSLILKDGTCLKVNLYDADILKDAKADEKVNAKAVLPISGSISAQQYKTWGFYFPAGAQSNFYSTWSPSSSTVLVGIVNSSGDWQWYNTYTGGCNVTATFNTSGTYYWVMWNLESSSITYSGSITY